MAEIVGFHVERLIPELEQMKRIKLYKDDEISEIIKRRKEFEYKLERTTKEKQDFLAYINYEVKLLRQIKLRRDKFRVTEKKDEIEYSITKRVTKLYKMALSYFRSDVKLWMSYINFCTQTRFTNAVSEAYKQMLQVHADKTNLWKLSAKWELEEMNNVEGAINVLKTGLHHHPDSIELFSEAFRLELLYGSQKRKLGKETEEEISSRQEKAILRAEVHFKTSVKSINDIEYIILLLEIASQFDFAERLQNQIIEYMTTNCWKSELMWHTMAQRELKGLHYDKNKENKSKEQLCIAVYKSALKVLPKSVVMWEKYLDTLIDLCRDKTKSRTGIQDVLQQALEEASNANLLLEKHYLIWIDMLDNNPTKQKEILLTATSSLPQSVKLWITRLRHHMINDEESMVHTVAREAMNTIKEKSLPVYKALIQYYNTKPSSLAETKALFEEGIMKEPEIANELKPLYIEWLLLKKNIRFARQEYEKISLYAPYCLELHKKMIELENGRTGPLCVNALRNVHKLACQQFGKSRTDVWLDHIKFEMNVDPRLISDIYNTAKNALNANLVDTFAAEFALLNTPTS